MRISYIDVSCFLQFLRATAFLSGAPIRIIAHCVVAMQHFLMSFHLDNANLAALSYTPILSAGLQCASCSGDYK